MDVLFKSCLRCRKVFAKSSDSNVCGECTEVLRRDISVIEKAVERDGRATPEQIAGATRLPVSKIKDLIESAGEIIEPEAPVASCGKCGEKPAQVGSPYCFDCRYDLFHSLGDAAGDLEHLARSTAHQSRRKSDVPSVNNGISDMLASKRRRTGTHRFNPAPTRGKKYG